jgi:creatinine amidohydrolase
MESRNSPDHRISGGTMTVYRFETLFPPDLETRLQAVPMLVMPLGTLEWHSYHLPLGLDGLVAAGIAERIADLLDAVLLPVSYWAAGGVPYPYTLKLPGTVVEPLLVALFEQFGEMGFRVITAFTGHFGLEQTLILKRAAHTVMKRSPVAILPITDYDLIPELYAGDHAGIGETSLLWALRPDLIHLDAVNADQPLDGVLGADPRGAAHEAYGRELLDAIVSRAGSCAARLAAHTPLQRAHYLEVLGLTVQILAATFEQRQTLPKSRVPAITTPAYLACCGALYRGDYDLAKKYAEMKLADLTA